MNASIHLFPFRSSLEYNFTQKYWNQFPFEIVKFTWKMLIALYFSLLVYELFTYITYLIPLPCISLSLSFLVGNPLLMCTGYACFILKVVVASHPALLNGKSPSTNSSYSNEYFSALT